LKLRFSKLPMAPDAAFPDRDEISRPIVAIMFTSGYRSVVIFAVADSGADMCVFPYSVAVRLGIEIPNS
jgi:hypothetical protein